MTSYNLEVLLEEDTCKVLHLDCCITRIVTIWVRNCDSISPIDRHTLSSQSSALNVWIERIVFPVESHQAILSIVVILTVKNDWLTVIYCIIVCTVDNEWLNNQTSIWSTVVRWDWECIVREELVTNTFSSLRLWLDFMNVSNDINICQHDFALKSHINDVSSIYLLQFCRCHTYLENQGTVIRNLTLIVTRLVADCKVTLYNSSTLSTINLRQVILSICYSIENIYEYSLIGKRHHRLTCLVFLRVYNTTLHGSHSLCDSVLATKCKGQQK